MTVPSRLFLAMLLLAGALLARPVEAAKSYDTCTGFIDSLPATIGTQGTWCLRDHLGTNITSGVAIAINVNNVTIDCNNFKVGGLAAGDDSTAFGIVSTNHRNITVRNCSVRGFYTGINLHGGGGHVIEGNRLDNNLFRGIDAVGSSNRILRNAVYDTGGYTDGTNGYAYGIYASGSIADNTVSGLFAAGSGNRSLVGIWAKGTDTWVRNNMISGFASVTSGSAVGIVLRQRYQRASGNHVIAAEDVSGASVSKGISVDGDAPNFCLDNTVTGFNTGIDSDCITPNVAPP